MWKTRQWFIVEQNLWRNLSFHIGQIKNKQNILWTIYFLKVPQTWECDTDTLPLSFPPTVPWALFLPATQSGHKTHRQTCNCSSPRPHITADADLNMLPFCSSVFEKYVSNFTIILMWYFFSPAASESHNNRAGGQWEGSFCGNINKSESIRCRKDGKFHNKKQCVWTVCHNGGGMCTWTSTWMLCVWISGHFC